MDLSCWEADQYKKKLKLLENMQNILKRNILKWKSL